MEKINIPSYLGLSQNATLEISKALLHRRIKYLLSMMLPPEHTYSVIDDFLIIEPGQRKTDKKQKISKIIARIANAFQCHN